MITTDEACRDLIIRATNSQTAISVASLRATDPVQRDIEVHFEHNGLHYDRRKNYHKLAARPIDKIISISYLAQAITAILLHEPDNARARPSSLLKDDKRYARVFAPDCPVQVYMICARIMRKVDEFLKAKGGAVSQSDKTNLRFYLATWATCHLLGKAHITPSDLVPEQESLPTDEDLGNLLEQLRAELEAFSKDQEFASDKNKAAKSRKFRQRVLDLVEKNLPGPESDLGDLTEVAGDLSG